MPDDGKKPMLRPAIIIGLGGTGNQVVRRMKKFVKDHYGDTPMLLKFLVMDTDKGTFEESNWTNIAKLEEHEKLNLRDDVTPFSDVRDNPKAYPEIHDWLLPHVQVGLLDHGSGAGQVRMLGRVALYKSFPFFASRIDAFFRDCEKIKNMLEEMGRYEFTVGDDPIVYIVSSVCGGQGAGSFIDVAVGLRALSAIRHPGLNLVGVLAMPSVYEYRVNRDNWTRLQANTHGAMKEVDYLMHNVPATKTPFRFPDPIGRTVIPQSPLFDLCYLIDIRHQRGALSNDSEVFDQIATELFLEIGTPFGARNDSVNINLGTIAGVNLDVVYKTGRRYSSFGNHTISFKRENIVELASLKSAYVTVHDRLLGQTLTIDDINKAVGEFISRHRIDESQTDDLVNTLITSREIGQELITAAWAEGHPHHSGLSTELWSRLDAFWQRRANDLRAQMERRARTKLDGSEQQRGILADLDDLVENTIHKGGVLMALDLVNGLLAGLNIFEELMRSEHKETTAQAQQFFKQAETSKTELANLGHELDRLTKKEERISLFSRIWRGLGIAITLGAWKPGAADEDAKMQQVSELENRAQSERDTLKNRANDAIQKRLASEAREVAASLYAEVANPRLTDTKMRLERIKQNLEEANQFLSEQYGKMNTEVKRTRFIDGNSMRRDVTADYVEQYHQMHVSMATDEVTKWLFPAGQSALDSLEKRSDREQIRQRFYDLYAEDILKRNDRDSLAEMIERFHTHGQSGSLTDRIDEGLRFCLPFWNIRVQSNQLPTEVLLVGMEQEYAGVQDFLDRYTASQKTQVTGQIAPTEQDSVILISRIAHGASYYWHAEAIRYFHEYAKALEASPHPIHINAGWRSLPEPIPDPTKYERRVFALGIAFEQIAVRGGAYFLDPDRKLTLVGTTRHVTPDWKTVQLLETQPPTNPSINPSDPTNESMIDDDNRIEAMQKFVDTENWVAAVRIKLYERFQKEGRDAFKAQIERYCREELQPALTQLNPEDAIRSQLEAEDASLGELLDELKPGLGLKLER